MDIRVESEKIIEENKKGEKIHLNKKERFIKQILEREEIMFKDVTIVDSAVCKKRLKTFKLMREAHFSSWSNRTLKGYLIDLKNAIQAHRNLVTERYARMEKVIVSEKENKLIKLIVATEKEWFLELNGKYPHVMGNVTNFINYLECELSTYSDLTIKYYFEDLKQAKLVAKNLVETRYLTIYIKLGYSSLQEVEEFYLKEDKN